MRFALAAALLGLLCGSAGAQPAPPATLLAPTPYPAPAPAPSPGPSPAPAAPAVPAWIPGRVVKLEVLDKVDAVSRNYTVPVGQSVAIGSLTIAVQACDARPPNQPVDAAAYLVITDSHPDEPGFKGWMLAAEPWVAMMQSPLYDVRVLQCLP